MLLLTFYLLTFYLFSFSCSDQAAFAAEVEADGPAPVGC
jgi:hypothetical protein